MPTDFSNNPNGGWIEAGGYLFLSSPTDSYGVLPSELLIGGHQEFITISDRDDIPVDTSGSGVINPDNISSGRRKIGMVVRVVDPNGDGSVESKTYCLLPKGYFGNGDSSSISDWNLLSDQNKIVLLDPTASVTYTDESFNQVTVTGTGIADDCWVELIQFTEHPLPAGGLAGEVLAKIDTDDYNVAWVSPQTGAQGADGAEGAQGANGAEGAQGATGAESSYEPNTSQSYRLDVVGGVFESGGVSQPSFLMLASHRYQILQITASNVGHPVKLSDTLDGTHGGGTEYTTGVTYTGTAGTDGVLTIDVTINTPTQLYYYCENHAGMGGVINVSTIHDFYNGSFNTHLIPDTNATYDIGSAEYKIRHLYLSDNSAYFGDNDVPLNSTKVLNTLNFSLDPALPGGPNDPAGGVKGDIRFDLNYLYICVEDGQWKRVALDNTWST